MALSEPSFRRQILALSREEFLAFLVDLWEARGWDTEHSAGTVRLTDPGTRSEKTLYPVLSPEDVPREAAIVVLVTESDAVETPTDVNIYDLTDLYEMTKWGVERDVSEMLLASHLSLEPAETEDDASDSESSTQATRDSTQSDEKHKKSDGNQRQSTESPDNSTDEGGDEQKPTTRRAVLFGGGVLVGGLGVLAVTVGAGRGISVAAPGVTRDGVVDPEALADAHVDVLADTSYSLRYDYLDTSANRQLAAHLSMDLSLADDRSFLTRIGTAGPNAPRLFGEPPASRVYWSDGTEYLAQRPDEETFEYLTFEPNGYVGTWEYWAQSIPFGGTPQGRPVRYYRTLFEAIPTKLVGRETIQGETRYRVSSDDTAELERASLDEVVSRDAQDISLTALIDEAGLVCSVMLQYTETIRDATFDQWQQIDYSAVGDTTVERPDWYDRATE